MEVYLHEEGFLCRVQQLFKAITILAAWKMCFNAQFWNYCSVCTM